MRAGLVVAPARVGANDLRISLSVPRVEELTVELTQRAKGIGPIRLDVPRAGRGRYRLRGVALGVPGTWDVVVRARVSDFDEYTARTRLTVAP